MCKERGVKDMTFRAKSYLVAMHVTKMFTDRGYLVEIVLVNDYYNLKIKEY